MYNNNNNNINNTCFCNNIDNICIMYFLLMCVDKNLNVDYIMQYYTQISLSEFRLILNKYKSIK